MIINRNANGSMSEWLKEADCKSARYAYAGSNPARPILEKERGFIPLFYWVKNF